MLNKFLQNKVFQNFSYLTLGSIISQVLMLITVVKITYELSSNDYGTYSFIIAQGMLLITIAELGTKSIIVRSIARNPDNTMDLLINGTKLRIITIFGTLLLYLAYNELLGSLTLIQISLLGFYIIVNSMFYLFEHIFLGHQKMFYPSVIKSLISFLYFGIVLLLPKNLFNVEILIFSYTLLHVAQTSLFYLFLKKEGILNGKPGRFVESSKIMLSESWPYMGLMFFSLPMGHMADNFLDINSTKEQVGYFNLAKKLIGPVQLIIAFSMTALFPNISAMFVNNNEKLRSLIYQGFHIFILFIAFSAFSFSLFSKDLVLLIFSDRYMEATTVIQLQVWYIFLSGTNYFITIVLGASNMEKEIIKLAFVNLLISAPFLYYGSLYGAIGISYGFVTSYAIFGIYIWYKFKNLINIRILYDNLIWIISILLFLISYSKINEFEIIPKLMIYTPIASGLLIFIFISIKNLKISN